VEERILSLPGVKDASSAIVLDTVKEPPVMVAPVPARKSQAPRR
jgi:hypothetical protein